LAGADTSELAVRLLREDGFEAIRLSLDQHLPSASFNPDVLTLLDVIEHFPPGRMVLHLAALLKHFRPRLLVVKVPISGGLLYRSTRVLRRLGAPAAIEQLYQVGTDPPHFHYFSRSSLARLSSRLNLQLAEQITDLDFEPEELAHRARPLEHLGAIAQWLGRGAARVASELGWQDSVIVVLRINEYSQP
jgi:hypothetical protein